MYYPWAVKYMRPLNPNVSQFSYYCALWSKSIKTREFLFILIDGHMIFVNYRIWLFCIRLINSSQHKVHWVQGLGLHFDWLNRLCLVDESVVGFRQLQVRGGMILSLKDNVKRCCIAVKEVSFHADALLFRARLISLKIQILLLVIFPHLIFWFHVKTFQIHLRLKMLSIQHPEFIMTTKKMDGFQSNCSDLQVSLILCMNNPPL